MLKFWNWHVANEETEENEERILEIGGCIAEESWYDDEVTPKLFKDELMNGKGNITVYINSPGGDCIAASQIYTMLKEYPYNVTVKIDGMAASAASVVAMAGDIVMMAPTAMMMIHDPLTMAIGNADDMRHAIDVLNEYKEAIINAYENKCGMSRKKIADLMSAETWMNAKKALELGFIDKIMGDDTAPRNIAAKDFMFSPHDVASCVMNKIISKIPHDEPKQMSEPNMVDITDITARLNNIEHY